MTVTYDDVLAARQRISSVLARTPVKRARRLEELVSAKAVWLKLESWHVTGSFKERGALNALLSLDEAAKAAGVVTVSAGNHAQALAHHARRLGVTSTVVMPVGTPHVKIAGAKRFGAKVILHGAVFDEAAEEARRIEREEGRTLIHAFDNADVVAGQGTATLELLEDAPDLDFLLVPVGGGGLISGALLAVEGMKAKTKVLGVEPEMYPSFRNALSNGEPVTGGDTIAEGIAVKSPGAVPLSVAKPRMSADDVVVIDEAAIEEGVVALAMEEKLIAEGAGAAGVGALLARPELFKDKVVGVLMCGGNIDERLLGQVLSRHLVRRNLRARVRVECTDRPGRLADITAILHKLDVNVIDVMHDRLALTVPAKETVIDVIIETDHEDATKGVVEKLQQAGYKRARLIESL